jgi:hypothetical protein
MPNELGDMGRVRPNLSYTDFDLSLLEWLQKNAGDLRWIIRNWRAVKAKAEADEASGFAMPLKFNFRAISSTPDGLNPYRALYDITSNANAWWAAARENSGNTAQVIQNTLAGAGGFYLTNPRPSSTDKQRIGQILTRRAPRSGGGTPDTAQEVNMPWYSSEESEHTPDKFRFLNSSMLNLVNKWLEDNPATAMGKDLYEISLITSGSAENIGHNGSTSDNEFGIDAMVMAGALDNNGYTTAETTQWPDLRKLAPGGQQNYGVVVNTASQGSQVTVDMILYLRAINY